MSFADPAIKDLSVHWKSDWKRKLVAGGLALLLSLRHTTVIGQLKPDSVTLAASLQYRNPGLLNTVLLGSNYRKVWQTPVRLPVFYLRRQGFRIKELGGGNQTLSLQLVDREGREWALRTVEKNVAGALPPLLGKTFVRVLAQEQVSGAHPYAPLVVAPLTKALGVPAPDPVFYFVPDDPDLGAYRTLFAGTMCMLEERGPTPDRSRTQNTEKVLERLVDKGSVRPDGALILRARALDLLVGDWDRHAGQWRWADKSPQLVYAIPRDRDQAFYFTNGLLPRILQKIALRFLVSFNDDLSNWRSLTYKSWPFDRYFLSGLDRDHWARVLGETQAALSDSVLTAAVDALPPEIRPLSRDGLLRKLKGRRDQLQKRGLSYYRFLSGYVDVFGSDTSEEFEVSGAGDTLRVRVFKLEGERRGRLLYDRRFLRSDTRLVRLRGMRGADRFVVAGDRSRIRVQIGTDDGDDQYHFSGEKRVRRIRR